MDEINDIKMKGCQKERSTNKGGRKYWVKASVAPIAKNKRGGERIT